MPRSRPVRSSFVAGAWSPLLQGRVDIEKYVQAARLIRNWLVQPQGGITRRPGSHFVAQAKARDYDPALLGFEYGPSQSYVLELGEFYIRFFTLQGQLIASMVTSGIVNGDFSQGLTGWTDTSVAGGSISVTNGDVLVQGDDGTPAGNMTLGGGLAAALTGGINTKNFYAYHRLSLTGGSLDDGFGLARVRFFEGNQVALELNDGTSLGNFTANTLLPTLGNDGVLQGSASRIWSQCAQSAGVPGLIGMHWSRARKLTGFQVVGTADRGFKFGTDPTVTIALEGSPDNFVTTTQLAQVIHTPGGNTINYFSQDRPGDWVNCARSSGVPANIGFDWGAGHSKRITGFVVRGSDDHGFKKNENPEITIDLQGSNDNFATVVQLARLKITDRTGPVEATIRRRISIASAYRYHRLQFRGGLTENGFAVKELTFYEAASDVQRLRLTPGAGTAAADQAIPIAADDIGKLHSLRFRVFADSNGAITVRVGSVSDLGDFSPITLVRDGEHTITFLPTKSPAVLQFRSYGSSVVDVDNVTLLSDQPYEVGSPYTRAQVHDQPGLTPQPLINVEQAGDVMWIAHPRHPLRKLIRRGHTDWTLEQAALTDGPYLDINLDNSVTIQASATTGTAITLTASSDLFKAGHVGSQWRLCAVGGEPGCKTWVAGDTIAAGEFRKYARNVYRSSAGGTAGNSPPIHERGSQSDGAVTWTFWNRDGWGYVTITDVTSSTTATARGGKPLDQSVTTAPGTAVWREGAFSDAQGWPEVVALCGDRLLLAKGIAFYLSQVGLFDDFSPDEEDDSAIYGQISGSLGSPIRWATGHQRIVMGTDRGPWVLRSSNDDEAITPKNVQVRRQNAAGSSALPALQAEDAIVYFSRSKRRLYELSPAVDPSGGLGYRGVDLTVLASDILTSGAIKGVIAKEPQTTLWVCRKDGLLATLTYSQAESVTAWSLQDLGGIVVSHATIPGANDAQARDEVWACVRREIAGETNRYVEFIEQRLGGEEPDPADGWFVDSGVKSNPVQLVTLQPGGGADQAGATGVPFTVGANLFAASDVGRLIRQTRTIGLAEISQVIDPVTVLCEIIRPFSTLQLIDKGRWALSSSHFEGLDHLDGATVRILVDGAEHPDRIVDQGAIDLQQQGFEVVVGLPADSRYESLAIIEGGAAGPSIGTAKRASRLSAGLVNSGDVFAGFLFNEQLEETLEELILRRAEQPISFTPPPLLNGIAEVQLDVPYDKDPRLVLECRGVRPATVTHIQMNDLAVEELA